MKYEVRHSSQFKRELKLAIKRNYDINKLEQVINMLENDQRLPVQYKDHSLSQNWAGYRECHILSDWLLIYQIDETDMTLNLARTGTHSDIYDK